MSNAGTTRRASPRTVKPEYFGAGYRLLEAARDLGASRWEAFRRVTLRLSRPAIVAGVLLTSLPMLGDYFTSDLLSGSPRTSMAGNLINSSVQTPGQTGRAGGLPALVVAAGADRGAPTPKSCSSDRPFGDRSAES